MVLKYSIMIFITQLVFIGCRTWNVRAIAKRDLGQVLLSGAIVHITWLIGIALGSVSVYKVINDFSLEYLPILLCSLIGSLIGSWLGLKEKKLK